jgi:hypothetical protein
LIQDPGYKIQDSGYRIQDTGYKIQDTGSRIQDSGSRNQDQSILAILFIATAKFQYSILCNFMVISK